MVDQVYDKICDGKPFPVVHWRNRTGENCLQSGYWSKRACKEEDSLNIQIMSQLTDLMVQRLLDYLDVEKYECVYIASPPIPQEFVLKIAAKFPHTVTLSHVLKLSPEISKHRDDVYAISILEQEIAVRADLFIGWRESSWTQSVYRMRNSKGRKNVPLPRVPGMPKVLQVIW
uniref:Uncharacterized protein LOC102804401 n=1 Tax=Saccoglossus kowalevskii TaxID=10224 RepID=A0ABM0MWF9_SACKO|nr:PREDICTED: uncharacterized protein LOC102804401 [Saccoglossus kowalevskii]